MSSCTPRNTRSVYLVTYSQANLEIVPSRTDFATIVKDAFEKTGTGNEYIAQHYNIEVNFSDGPGNYYEAWLYCSKSDKETVTSENHPDFTRAPRTIDATSQKRAAAKSNSGTFVLIFV